MKKKLYVYNQETSYITALYLVSSSQNLLNLYSSLKMPCSATFIQQKLHLRVNIPLLWEAESELCSAAMCEERLSAFWRALVHARTPEFDSNDAVTTVGSGENYRLIRLQWHPYSNTTATMIAFSKQQLDEVIKFSISHYGSGSSSCEHS